MAVTTYESVSANIIEALNRVETDDYARFLLQPLGSLFGGGVTINDGERLNGGGVRFKFQTEAPMNTYAMGVPTGDTAVPNPITGLRYDNVVYLKDHIPMILSPAQVSDVALEEIIEVGNQDGLEDLVTKALKDVMADFNDVVSILQVTGRAGVLGTITKLTTLTGTQLVADSVYATDEASTAFGTDPGPAGTAAAFTGRYRFLMELGNDVIMPAFRKGRVISVCAAPTSWGTSSYVGGAVGHVRNYYGTAPGTGGSTTAMVICDLGKSYATTSSDGTIFRVEVCMYYTAASKTSVADLISHITQGAVGTGDVVTLWCGELALANTPKTRGGNFGRQGLMHWFYRTDIEDAGLATTVALKDSEGNSISRDSGGNMDFWYPYVNDVYSAGLTSVAISQLTDVAKNLVHRNQGRLGETLMPVANSVLIDSLTTTTGAGTYRQMADWDTKLRERWQTEGYSGIVFQSSNFRPTPVAENDWVPPMMIPFMRKGIFSYVHTGAGRWGMKPAGGMWYPRYNSDGALLLSSQAFYRRRFQINARDLWMMGGVMHCKP